MILVLFVKENVSLKQHHERFKIKMFDGAEESNGRRLYLYIFLSTELLQFLYSYTIIYIHTHIIYTFIFLKCTFYLP